MVSWRRWMGAADGLMEEWGPVARPLATTMEQTELVGVEGPRLYWRITLWLPLGRRGRYASYAVSTRLLPSGRIEVVGPSGRARRLAPGAEQCGCGRPECIHLRGMRAHLAEVVQHEVL